MQSNVVNYTINVAGNAAAAMGNITQQANAAAKSVSFLQQATVKVRDFGLAFSTSIDLVNKTASAFGNLVGSSLEAEQQQANMKTLFLGNAQAAKEMYDRVSEYAKATPYNRNGLIEAQKTMMAFGIEGETAFKTLKQIGDIALGDAGKMQSLSLAFAQISSAGKLSGQDLMQMINAGFNPLNEISKMTGKSIADLKEAMSKGAISADMVAIALQSATAEGGQFHGAMNEASQSVTAKISTMKDAVDSWKVSLFEATGGFTAYASAVGEMVAPLASLIPFLTTLFGATKMVFTGIKSLVIALKGLSLQSVWAGIVSGFTAFKTAGVSACRAVGTAIMNIPLIGWIAAAIAALVAIGVYFWNTSATFRATLKGLWAGFKATFTGIGDLAKTVFGGIGDLIKAAFRLDGDGISKALEKMKGGFSDFGGEVSKAFNGAYAEEIERSKKEKETKDKAEQSPDVAVPPVPAMNIDPTAGSLSSPKKQATSAGEKIKNVTVNVDKLVEKFEIRTTNLNNDLSQVKNMVSEALLSALNDVNLAM